jgi:hypothetical protein
MAENDAGFVNFPALYGFGVIFAAIALFNLYLLYRIVAALFSQGAIANIVIMLAILFVFGMLPL